MTSSCAQCIDTEGSRVGESVQYLQACRVRCHAAPILPLVQVEACLLAGHDVDDESVTVLVYLEECGRHLAVEKPGLPVQSLLESHGRVAALVDAQRSHYLRQQLEDRRLVAFDTQGQPLRHQPVTVAVDDEPGQLITLGMHKAVGCGPRICVQCRAGSDGAFQATSPEIPIDLLARIPRQKTHTDLRPTVDVATRQPIACRTDYIDHITIGCAIVDLLDGAGEDPGMVQPHGFLSSRLQACLRHSTLLLHEGGGAHAGSVVCLQRPACAVPVRSRPPRLSPLAQPSGASGPAGREAACG